MASIYDEQLMNKSDIERIKELADAWQNTTDSKKRKQLHSEAEAIRNSYGYSGGGDGSQFILNNADVMNVGAAGSAYSNAIRDSEEARQQTYKSNKDSIDADAQARLREAYVKNMQSQLGLDQALRASGITGGLSESTYASLKNNYNTSRDGIKSDAKSAKLAIALDAAESAANTEKEAAKADYDSANDRTDMLIASEQKTYDRQQDAYDREEAADDREFERLKFKYQQSLDEYDRQYQEQMDALKLAYQKQKDELDRKLEEKKIAVSASKTKSSSKTSSDDGQDDLEKVIWKLLNKGVYDPSFSQVLGVSDEWIRSYQQNVLAGY